MRERQDADKDSATRRQQPRRGASAPESGTAAHLLHLQRTLGNAAVARMVEGAQDEPVVQRRSAAHDVLNSAGSPLDAPVLDEMNHRLGADFSDVQVHTDSIAQRSTEEMGARAWTSGNHVVLGPQGRDRHTLAHELTHVLQQKAGPVAGTDTGDGLAVSHPSDPYERAAEENARKAMSAPLKYEADDSDYDSGYESG